MGGKTLVDQLLFNPKIKKTDRRNNNKTIKQKQLEQQDL